MVRTWVPAMPNVGKVIVLSVHAITETRQPRLFAMGLCAAMTKHTDSMRTQTAATETVVIVTKVPTETVATETVAITIRKLLVVISRV